MQGKKALRTAVHTAAKRNILAGYRRDFLPSVPRVAEPLLEERDCLRREDPFDPEVDRLDTEINSKIGEEQRKGY